jgi:hypothetical protein
MEVISLQDLTSFCKGNYNSLILLLFNFIKQAFACHTPFRLHWSMGTRLPMQCGCVCYLNEFWNASAMRLLHMAMAQWVKT